MIYGWGNLVDSKYIIGYLSEGIFLLNTFGYLSIITQIFQTVDIKYFSISLA